MNGRSPTMCVTVLQSQPSVSIPTLTMQRTSRPGGCSGRSELRRELLEPLGIDGRPCGSRGQSRLPTVSSVNRIQRVSSPFAPSTSVSPITFESTRIVYRVAVLVAQRRRWSPAGCPRRRLALGEPLVDHAGELRVLADEDEDRRTLLVALLPLLALVVPRSARAAGSDARRTAAPPPASGFARFPPRSRAGELAHDPAPDVEVRRLLLARRIRDARAAGS